AHTRGLNRNCHRFVPHAPLSEGERTFITFLYYFHSLSGVKQDNESDKVVAIIDDPISSLDGDIMFVVSALTRMLVDETIAGDHKRLIRIQGVVGV
ncbi:AAA family ATPase, partial [Kocuria marina]|uniref:AAA family ATPase n=1 Tax=Kocuria marina TaxID=223184 RepID=UPI0022DEDCB7